MCVAGGTLGGVWRGRLTGHLIMDLMFWVSFLAFWGCTLGQTRQISTKLPKKSKIKFEDNNNNSCFWV